jgi:uncharacterized membrane protein
MLPLALVVAFLWAVYPFILKYYNTVDDPIVTWAIFSITAAIVSIIIVIARKKNLLIGRKALPIIASALIGPVAAMLVFIYLVELLPKTSLVVALAFTSPLFAVAIGYMFFKERLSASQCVGALLVVLGIFLLVR